MRILVTYWSKSGNTRKVAEAIFKSLSCEKVIKPFDQVDSFEGFDLIFIGFPVMQFGPPAPVRKFITTFTPGKKIALFVTHALITGSEDPHYRNLLRKELDQCRSLCAGADLMGMFHCQGELSKPIADTLLTSNNPLLMEFAAMRPLTIGHPDVHELEEARDFAQTIISGL
ncbi:MAG: flavodoxin family protein [Bacteroidales bacterium]|jgi:flavodoxin|nr:flavodoxin family protein [Bacteroidales bacterium]